jgi:hypothetical protein
MEQEKITTIEDLASMIQRNMASKEDVKALRKEMKEGFDGVYAELDGLKDEVGQFLCVVIA